MTDKQNLMKIRAIKKVRLAYDVPVDKKHGMKRGRIFEICLPPKGKQITRGSTWVRSDTGEPVRIFNHEFDFEEDG